MEFNATFIIAFFSFIVFIFVMNIIMYEPINRVVSKRRQIIDDNYETAEANSSKSRAILSQKEEKLLEAKSSSRKETLAALAEADSIKSKKLTDAKEKAKIIIEENKAEAENEKKKTVSPLKDEIVDLAQLISDKILKSREKIENIDGKFIEDIIRG